MDTVGPGQPFLLIGEKKMIFGKLLWLGIKLLILLVIVHQYLDKGINGLFRPILESLEWVLHLI